MHNRNNLEVENRGIMRGGLIRSSDEVSVMEMEKDKLKQSLKQLSSDTKMKVL